MQKILLIIHAAPYGSERCLSALRLALMLANGEGDAKAAVEVFLMSDATVLALPGQQDASGHTLQEMVEMLSQAGVPIKVCKTCAGNRGLLALKLIDGCAIGTLSELAQATLAASKVLTF